MYLLHCKKCHHEWESVKEIGTCDWCGAGSYLLQEHHFDIIKIFEIIKAFMNKDKKSGL